MSPDVHFSNIDYLSKGNQRQIEACEILNEVKVLEILREYTPILVGTIPIDIDISASDLDIICEVHDFKRFEDLLNKYFHNMNEFICSLSLVNGVPRIVCNYQHKGWKFEIFGQSLPTIEQNGYKHMIIENRILKLLGNKGNEWIRDLKKSGLKTEPAFGKLLKLDGDPYELLLQMYDWDDHQLCNQLKKFTYVDWNGHYIRLTWLPSESPPRGGKVSSVHGVCFDSGKVLLVNVSGRGYNYPGGHVEEGETPEQAFQREALEEGYVIGNSEFIGMIEVNHEENPIYEPNGKYPIVGYQLFYRMNITECLPFLRENESISRIWVEPSELPYVINDHELSYLVLDEALKSQTVR